MKVILGFIFRDADIRGEIFSGVKPIMAEMYPWMDVLVVDSGHQPFNRAASRNLVVKMGLEKGADVVVICDADSIPDQEVLIEAINQAYEDNRVHIPFDIVRVLASRQAYTPNKSYLRARAGFTYGPSVGGIFVCRPEVWVFIGGMDERIQGWGYEDQIILRVLNTFLEGAVHHPGNLYNFQHGRGQDLCNFDENMKLRDQYNRLEGNKEEIRRLQRGSNSFCSDSAAPEQSS